MSTFQVGLEHLELLEVIYYSLIPIFAQYYFKTGTLCLSTAVKLDSNYFGVLLWKKVKPRSFNEIKPPIAKIFQKYKPGRHYFVMSQK